MKTSFSSGFAIGALLLSTLLPVHAQRPAAPAAHAQQRATLTPADAALFRDALTAYDAGDLSRAQTLLAPLAGRYTGNAEVQAAEGSVLVESNRLDAGIPFLERSIALHAANDQVATNLGVAYLKSGQPVRAMSLLQSICRRSPQTSCTAYAQAQLAAGQYAGAAATFQSVAQSSDTAGDVQKTPEFRHDWALALMGADRPKEALAVLEAAPDRDGNAALQELTGEAEEKLGHYEQAFAAFQRAAKLDPSQANLFHYGNDLLQHWSFPAAIQIFEYAVRQFPQSEQMQAGLGVAYFGNNDFAHAAAVFEQQLTRSPDNAQAADLLGRSCSALGGSTPAGCSGLVSFAHRHPQNANACLYAAITLLQQPSSTGTGREAEDLLRAALATNRQLPEAWYQLAVLQQANNDWDGSALSLQKAIALRPGYAEAHYRLSRAYAHTGRKADAQQEIALQQKYAASTKEEERHQMQEVMTFLTSSN